MCSGSSPSKGSKRETPGSRREEKRCRMTQVDDAVWGDRKQRIWVLLLPLKSTPETSFTVTDGIHGSMSNARSSPGRAFPPCSTCFYFSWSLPSAHHGVATLAHCTLFPQCTPVLTPILWPACLPPTHCLTNHRHHPPKQLEDPPLYSQCTCFILLPYRGIAFVWAPPHPCCSHSS